MGIFLNPQSTYNNFKNIVNSDIYVDKTDIIEHTNKILNTDHKYICISRPRRFGKTTAADTLSAYYCQTFESESVFSNLKASECQSYKDHLNKHNVIYINLLDCLGYVDHNVKELISAIKNYLIQDLKDQFADYCKSELPLMIMLQNIKDQTGQDFIFIIDEWDCLFREAKDDDILQKEYLKFLRDLLKGKNYVSLAYMTGILPIKKYGTQSALNMFNEYTMIDMDEFASFTGFTEDEVKGLCDQYSVDFNEMKHWYDGYIVNGIHIYNPRSVVEIVRRKYKTFGSYWSSTETYETLKDYINMNFDGLKEAVIDMTAGACCPVDTSSFTNDMKTFDSKDDIFTLLIHLGYLAYNDETVFIPNEEIRKEFITSIKTAKWDGISNIVNNSRKLLYATLEGDEKTVASMIDDVHSKYTLIITYNNENSLSCVIAIAYCHAESEYSMVREMPTGRGLADFIFIPKAKTDKIPIIFELKFGKSADEAIEQIKARNYTDTLKTQGFDKAVLVGVNYNKDTKLHECRIERVSLTDNDN